MTTREATPSDAEVLLLVEDDPSAFRLLYDKHFASIYSYLARRLNPAAADDLTAETFAVAFARRTTYKPESPDARPWLYGIAANLMRQYRRSERRYLLATARFAGLADTEAAEIEGVDDRVAAEVLSPIIARALARLASRDREVLLLYAWGDLSYSEIAQALGIELGTVRSRLHRARQRVREELENRAAVGIPSNRVVFVEGSGRHGRP